MKDRIPDVTALSHPLTAILSIAGLFVALRRPDYPRLKWPNLIRSFSTRLIGHYKAPLLNCGSANTAPDRYYVGLQSGHSLDQHRKIALDDANLDLATTLVFGDD